jgi:hypothetical protein
MGGVLSRGNLIMIIETEVIEVVGHLEEDVVDIRGACDREVQVSRVMSPASQMCGGFSSWF